MSTKIVLPKLVKALCHNHDAWIVGGAARHILGEEGPPRDWDILVPFWTWGEACRLIPPGSPANNGGGFKVIEDGIEIDIWAGDLGWYLPQVPRKKDRIAYHPRTDSVLRLTKLQDDT